MEWSLNYCHYKPLCLQVLSKMSPVKKVCANKVSLRELVCLVHAECPELTASLDKPHLGSKQFPLHSGTLDVRRWSQDKTSQSNHEKRWVGRTGGRRKRGWERAVHVCMRASEWVGDGALHHQSYELRGPWLTPRGVCVSQSQYHWLCCFQHLKNLKMCEYLLFCFTLTCFV